MVRTKAVAVLLGPSGVGLVSLYVSITGLVSTIAQLGIDQSGVREVAEANGSGDPERVARVVKTLRRVCWFTGILGWILTVALAWPLSQWTFGSSERMWAVAILGVTVLIGAVTSGQTALLQGMRRIGDLARIQVLSAIITTIIAVGLYTWLGQQGVIPVIILTSVVQLGFSWYFSRRIQISVVPQSWAETTVSSKRLVGLGAAFMYGALLTAIVGVSIRALIVKDLGLEASGIYQAAWGLSGMFAGFILGAMGKDFYPRLTEIIHDDDRVNQLVNEQTEIGILMALPGLFGTLAFAPWIMTFFYSAKFAVGAELLPWFVIGVLGQVISWPMGFVMMAKGSARWIILNGTVFSVIHILLVIGLLGRIGLVGCGISFAVLYMLHIGGMLWLTRHLSGFRWSNTNKKLITICISLIALGYIVVKYIPGIAASVVGLTLFLLITFYCLRGIIFRVGSNHILAQKLSRFYRLT